MAENDSRFAYVRFTASGSEYFRIWAVNLLLTVVTLGLYLPFAKARRLRYFYANTVIDGHPLAFHGNPWSMLRGYAVVLVLFLAQGLATKLWPGLVLLTLPAMVLLWPVLWRSSLVFRMANTSWRGLRFGFDGRLSGAYGWLPSAVAAVLAAGLAVGLLAMALGRLTPILKRRELQWLEMLPLLWPLLAMAVAAVLAARALWLMKRYQHGGYRLGRQAASLEGSFRPFAKLGLKLVLWSTALQLFAIGVTAFLVPRIEASAQRGQQALAFSGLPLLLLVVSACMIAANASARAWVQNTVWRRTASPRLRFFSNVSAMELSLLSVVNAVLVVLTLGLYRPFAAVNAARMRLESIRVEFIGEAEDWQAALAPAQPGAATGEMAGDFFGFDVGF